MLYTEQQASTIDQHQFAFLVLDEKSHVLTITLNRPAKKNAMNATLMNELAYALSYAHYKKEVWIVVIAAHGDVFCAGADLKSFAGETQADDSSIPPPNAPVKLGDLFAGLHKPCIAKVHAPVYAGGFLIVCGCTHVLASNTATFSLPEVKRGIFPFQVMASLLTLMPPRQALDLCIRARTLSAAEALQCGLVSSVTNPETLDAAVEAFVDDLLQYSPAAIQMGLQAFQEMHRLPANEQHPYLHGMLQAVLKTDDAQEGIAAFSEKRKPIWKGK